MPDRNVVDDTRPLADHNRRQPRPRELGPHVAAALSVPDLALVGTLCHHDPGTWTMGELATLRQVRDRSGPEAGRLLGGLIHEAEQAIDNSHLAPLLQERRRVEDQLGAVQARQPASHARGLARARVTRMIREAEAQVRQEIREQYDPLIKSAPNAEHRAGVETAMNAELARAASRLDHLHRDRPALEAVEARKIEHELARENSDDHRRLTTRLNGINRELRRAGDQLGPEATEGLRTEDFVERMKERYGTTLRLLDYDGEIVGPDDEIDGTRSPAA